MVRGTNCSPCQTGRTICLLTPMMATSGRLITGVVTMPPSAPRLVIVMVEPVSSARVALPSRAASARRCTSAAQSHRLSDSQWRTTGTINPAGVWVAMPFESLRLVVIECVHLGKVGDRLDQSLHQERHQREARAIRAVLRIEGRA